MIPYMRYTYAQRPDLVDPASRLIGDVWPEFMLHDPVADRFWERLEREFSDFQFVLQDEAGEMLAVGNSIPILWDGDPASLPGRGWDAVLKTGFAIRQTGFQPDTLSALSISVAASRQGQGLSQLAVSAMRAIAAEHGFRALVAPVRPSLKSAYPLIPMEHYIGWRREDGAPFDPWLRVHWRLGAQFAAVATESMTITAPVGEWESWAGMRFPETGQYVIPGGLVPLEIDCAADLGRYVEPNVWMVHPVGEQGNRGVGAGETR